MGTRFTSRTTMRKVVVTGFALAAFALPVGAASAATAAGGSAVAPTAAAAPDAGTGTSPGAAPALTDGPLVNGWQ